MIMERKRIGCSKIVNFGGIKNPCHKILCDIVAEESVEGENETVTVKGLREIRLKCTQCKSITRIINVEE